MNAQPDVNQPRTPATDSRALQNLIKAEKTYVENLFSSTSAAMSAASSLQAWGISETPDMERATLSVTKWLEDVASAQRTHGQAIDQFREALKDVLDREHSIRSILRDREILISRVIKSGKRKPTRKEVMNGDEEHQAKIAEAQQELHACEQLLANESALLVGVKRRTFKEALAMRVKTMGDTGAVMMDSARSILLYLDDFDANVPVAPVPPTPLPEEVDNDVGSEFAPTASVLDHGTDYDPFSRSQFSGKNPPLPATPHEEPEVNAVQALDEPFVPEAVEQPKTEVRSPPRLTRSMSAQTPSGVRSSSKAIRSPSVDREQAPRRTRKTRSRAPSDASHISNSAMYLPQVPGGIPSAPSMNLNHMRSGFIAPSVPGGVPTAPSSTFRSTRLDNSSDEEQVSHRRNQAAYAPSSTDASAVPNRQARRRQVDSDDDEPHHGRKGSAGGGFFQRMSSLFRTEVRAVSNPVKSPRQFSRSDRNYAPLGDIPRASHVSRAAEDSSDEETPRNVVRHVNERPGSSLSSRNLLSPQRRTQGMRRSGSAAGKQLVTPEDDELTAAVRRSVIGAGISGPLSKPSSRSSSRQSTTTGRNSTSAARNQRRASMDMNEVSSANAIGPQLRTRSSSEQLGEKPVARRKRRSSSTARSSHPPPAPSSFYVGFSNNPGKFATDSWVAKASDKQSASFETPSAPPSVTSNAEQTTPLRPASAQERTRPSSYLSPSNSRSQPAKSAMKGTRSASASNTPKRLSLQSVPGNHDSALSLDLDNRFDGTGHIDFELASLITSGMSPSKENASLNNSAAQSDPKYFSSSSVTGKDDSQAYQSMLQSERPEGHEGLAPPLVGLPSFYSAPSAGASQPDYLNSTSHTAQVPTDSLGNTETVPEAALHSQHDPVPRKSVRIDSQQPVAHEDPSEEQDVEEKYGRARSSWSTRIGAREDSSDEETESGNPDGYKNARKAFGSATRHYGVATGVIQPKSEARKKKTSKSLDYNPSVQLPPGLHSIARSHR
ncbi:hypothetical protein MYAM1_001705 [Malassezia yamatoensis]|uniref:Uncharacterized protein n=1 Tax=Malassezia yamatoensis TaxID=253288 RepID=A0AAJ5YSI3_9BASI|nr:hypothetical protein MYAM1_001705 [Malassezia yamatoensis]